MIKGSIAALITPFDSAGQIDLMALECLLAFHKEAGTDGLVLAGSTGEGALLSIEEKLLIFETAQKIIGGHMPLIASTGTCNTQESVYLTREAKNRGMDACMAIVPYYVRPTPRGCLAHFDAIAKEGLPLIVYHHPGRTGTTLSASDLLPIIDLPGVVAIKDATNDFALARELIEHVPHLSGDDLSAFKQLSMGFAGSISIVANMIPRAWREFIATVDPALFTLIRPLIEALNLEPNPQSVKYGVSLLGHCLPHLRLPLIQPTELSQAAIKEQHQIVELALQSAQSTPSGD